MWKDSLLQSKEQDELLESFAVQFVPKFVTSCDEKFSATVWSDIALKQMSAKIAQLRSLKTTDGSIIVGGEANSSLSKVQDVISNYYAAKMQQLILVIPVCQMQRSRLQPQRSMLQCPQ